MSDSTTSVILLNYNTLFYTEQCIKSIVENTSGNYEIIVVENDSNDKNRIKKLEELSTSVKVIINDKNLGFGAGNNLGVKYAKGKFILILNNDTVIYPGTIEALKDINENYDDKTIVTGFIEDSTGNYQHSGGMEPRLFAELLRFGFLLIKYVPSNYYDNYYFIPKKDTKAKYIDWASGCFFFITKEFYENIGGFDEKMFMYVEDVEFHKRARLKGGKIIFNPKIRIKHFGSQSAKDYRDIILRSQYKNTVYYFKKHSNIILVIVFLFLSKTIFLFWYLLFGLLEKLPLKNLTKFSDKKKIYKTLFLT